MTFRLPADLSALTNEELAALLADGEATFSALLALEAPSEEEVTEAEAIAPLIAQVRAECNGREAEFTARRERLSALSTEPVDPEPEADPEGAPADPAPAVTAAIPAETKVVLHAEDLVQSPAESDGEFKARQSRYPSRTPAAPVQATNGTTASVAPLTTSISSVPAVSTVATVASRTTRPVAPRSTGRVAITASADVPGFSTGSVLDDLDLVGRATVNRMKGFPTPAGDGLSEDLRQYGVATFTKPFPEDLIINQTSDDMEIIYRAANERLLPGGSLTAAGGGWCAPSETLYDLCENESTEGILSIPEVQVSRGGIRSTLGPDWADIYTGVGFSQTEAQAIAATAKPCYDVTCPTFTDVRLDAVGLCIRVPILTNAAYPELVQRIIRGALVAHQHKVNAKILSALATALGTAVVGPDPTSTVEGTLTAVELAVLGLRNRYRMSFSATVEVVVPAWVKGALRADFALRNGIGTEVVTDAVLAAHFAARGANVQYVYDWQDLAAACPAAYPATFSMMVYPAGAFVKGTSSIINLNAVYDAASLATNTYTGLFFEEGVLVTRTCYGGCLYTVKVTNKGVTGPQGPALP